MYRVGIVRIEIELDDTERPSGRVSADDRAPVPFSGWVPLIWLLERLIASARLAARGLGDERGPR